MTESGEARLSAGRIGRPHGLDGSFHVLDPSPDLLGIGVRVFLDGEPTEIVGRKGTDAAPILRLAAAADRDAVAGLGGRELMVAREVAPALRADEYWAVDLVGCLVRAGGRTLGPVESMVAYPSCEVLVVGEHLIPMVRDAIRSVDVSAKRIEVDPQFLGI